MSGVFSTNLEIHAYNNLVEEAKKNSLLWKSKHRYSIWPNINIEGKR
jgi:hypothetical protein